MTTTISEKDKKLLIGLAIGLVIFGLVYLVGMPLYEKNTQLSKKIREETMLKQQYETKVRSLLMMQLVTEEDQKTLLGIEEMFYPLMTSTEIDNLITSQVMKYGLVAKDLEIMKAAEGDYTVLLPYDPSEEKSYEEEPEWDETEEETTVGGPYTGLRTAKVTISVTGEREKLQKFLDANINAGVKQRVSYYQWSNLQQENVTGLTVTVELYMCEDIPALLDQMVIEMTGGEAQEDSEYWE